MTTTRFSLYDPATDTAAIDSGAGGGSAVAAAGAATTAAPPAWHEGLITKGSDGGESLADFATWKDKAPAPLVKFITDNMTAARAKTEGMIRVPGADAKPEERAAFYAALGVPNDPTEYDTKPPEKLPEGIVFDEGKAKEFASFAKTIGLTKEQAAKIKDYQVESIGKTVAANRDAMNAAVAREMETMKTRFGDIDGTIATAKALENRAGVPSAMKEVIKNGAFDPKSPSFWGPDALEFAAWAAKATGEGSHQSGAATTLTGDLAAAKDIMANKDNPQYKDYWAGKKDVVDKVNAAYAAGAAR